MSVDTMSSDDLRDAMVDQLVADHAATGLTRRPAGAGALGGLPR